MRESGVILETTGVRRCVKAKTPKTKKYAVRRKLTELAENTRKNRWRENSN